MGEECADLGFIPCLWCGGPIALSRAVAAMQECAVPLYCSDPCRSDLERSLVKRIYDASEAAADQAGFADFAEFETATRAEFEARLRSATSVSAGPQRASTRDSIARTVEEPAVRLLN